MQQPHARFEVNTALVLDYLRHINKHTSVGPDGIHPKLMRLLSPFNANPFAEMSC